jgi:uncharacterized linocin/CFP29 family protein
VAANRPRGKRLTILPLLRFQAGQDLAIGYDGHDADAAHLYLEESFSFPVATPEAAAPLTS